jgi:hypothetical protein
MRWHKEEKRDSESPDIMSHPADSEAWEALDRFPRSVHLGLSTDDFQPHSIDSSPYSYWPLFVMPYNLSSNKFLKQSFIFLVLVIPDPKESKKQMNIFFYLFMEELKELW